MYIKKKFFYFKSFEYQKFCSFTYIIFFLFLEFKLKFSCTKIRLSDIDKLQELFFFYVKQLKKSIKNFQLKYIYYKNFSLKNF